MGNATPAFEWKFALFSTQIPVCRCAPVGHLHKLRLHYLPHLRLVVDAYEAGRANISTEGMVVQGQQDW